MLKDFFIGLDIGGTKMLAVLWDGEKIIADYQLATPKDSLNHFLIMAKAVIEPLLDYARENKGRVNAIGAGIAGAVSYESGKIINAPNLPILEGVRLADSLTEQIGCPVWAENDGDAFIRAEALLGAGRNYHSVYGLVIGTGIGGGWWHKNDIFRASGGGEPGAMLVDFSNNENLEKAYHRLMQHNPGAVAIEAYRGDQLADQIFAEMGSYLGKALANIGNLIAPDIFIIGGGVAQSSDLFLKEARQSLKDNLAAAELKKKCKISKSSLGLPAGAIGAALLAAANAGQNNDKNP